MTIDSPTEGLASWGSQSWHKFYDAFSTGPDRYKYQPHAGDTHCDAQRVGFEAGWNAALNTRSTPPVDTAVEGEVERLRRILARYGDRVPMAMCYRPDWQQTIDDALQWVANNPERLNEGGSNVARG